MTMPVKQFLNTLILMKACVIHYDHAFGFEAWNQCILAPVVKELSIDIIFEVINRKQRLFK